MLFQYSKTLQKSLEEKLLKSSFFNFATAKCKILWFLKLLFYRFLSKTKH